MGRLWDAQWDGSKSSMFVGLGTVVRPIYPPATRKEIQPLARFIICSIEATSARTFLRRASTATQDPLQARLQARFPVRFRRHQAHCGSASCARSARLHASSLPAVRLWTMDFGLSVLVFWSLGWSLGPLVFWSFGLLVRPQTRTGYR